MTAESNESAAANQEAGQNPDVLSKVAGAMVAAADAMKTGATDAQSAAAKVLPATGKILSKSAYATCYYVSYGVVFPTMLVAGLFPKNNPLYYGLVDGASAAKESVHKMHERRAAMKAALAEARQAVDSAAAAASPA